MQLPRQTEMQLVSSGPSVEGRYRRRRECSRYWAFFTREGALSDQLSLSVMCAPKNLVLITTSTAVCVDEEGCVAWSGSPEVYDGLLCLVDAQDIQDVKVVHPTP